MPNNFVRHKAGFVPVPSASIKAKRRDVVGSLRIVNKAFVTAGQELGSPNGGPAPTFAGGSQGGDFGGGGFGGAGGANLN